MMIHEVFCYLFGAALGYLLGYLAALLEYKIDQKFGDGTPPANL